MRAPHLTVAGAQEGEANEASEANEAEEAEEAEGAFRSSRRSCGTQLQPSSASLRLLVLLSG